MTRQEMMQAWANHLAARSPEMAVLFGKIIGGEDVSDVTTDMESLDAMGAVMLMFAGRCVQMDDMEGAKGFAQLSLLVEREVARRWPEQGPTDPRMN